MSATGTLRKILNLDAVTCLAMGALLIIAGGFVAELTGLPATLVLYAGIVLVPIGLFMAATASWWSANPIPVWSIILGNVGWVAGSLIVLSAVPSVSGLGVVFGLLQAAVVAVLAYLEWRALRSAEISALTH